MALFSKARDVKSDRPKRRNLFAAAFIPDIGASIRPLRQSTSVFTQLIASLFVMKGMFPREHPGLRGQAPLSLMEVLQTAYQYVSFDEKGMPKAIFFGVVVSCMALTTLVFLVGAMLLFAGKAHAAPTIFTPPDPANDLGQKFIDYLFQGQLITNFDEGGNASTVNGSNVIQCGLYTALGYYSDAILIVAAVVLFYHLAWMTVETAHHGQVMGQRGNQVWAPIRLVFAVGLLVPVSGNPPAGCGGGGAGLNAGQIIAITIAEWGSGLASNVWQIFLNQLAADTYNYVAPPIPVLRSLVANIVNIYACQYAFNAQLDPNYGNNLSLGVVYNAIPGTEDICDPQSGVSGISPGCPGGSPYTTTSNNATKYNYSNTLVGDQALCGSIIVPSTPTYSDTSFAQQPGFPQGQVTAIYNAVTAAYNQDLPSFANAGSNVQYFVNGLPNYGQPPAGTDVIGPLVTQFATDLDNGVNGAVNGNDPGFAAIAGQFTNDGWVTAGAWFNRIARVQSDLYLAPEDALPRAVPPRLLEQAGMDKFLTKNPDEDSVDGPVAQDLHSRYLESGKALVAMHEWLAPFGSYAPNPVGGTLRQQMELSGVELSESPDVTCGINKITDCIFFIVDHLAAAHGVWHSVPTGGGLENLLGVQFTGANPLAEVAAFGQANLDVAYAILDSAPMVMAAGSFVQGYAEGVSAGQQPEQKGMISKAAGLAGALATQTGSMMLSIAGIFFTIGFLMTFFVPLIPFIGFFFGVLAWVVAMLEAVIAMPLVALAHLTPEGDGLPGSLARPAYFFIFQVFLRPTLMIFGLLCGVLVFYIAVAFLNALFAIAAAGTGGLSHGHFTATRMFFTAIYVILVTTAANHSFQLITMLPDRAISWMGGSGLPGANFPSPGALEERIAIVSRFVSQGAMNPLGQASQAVGGGVGRALGGPGSGGRGAGSIGAGNRPPPGIP